MGNSGYCRGSEVFVEEGGGFEAGGCGVEGEGGDDAEGGVAEGVVEGLGFVAGGGVEHEESAAEGEGELFDGEHEGTGDAAAAGGGVDEEFFDFGAVGLIGGGVDVELDGADDVAVETGEQDDAGVGVDGSGDVGPEGEGVFEGEGDDEADAGALMDDVVKEEGELLEVGWGAGAPGGEGEGHEEVVRGLGFGILFAADEWFFLFAPVLEAAGGGDFVTGFGEHVRGTRGATTAVSSGEDGFVLGDFGEAFFEIGEGDVDVALEGAELFDFLGIADVEEEEVGLFLDEFFEFVGVGDFADGGVLGEGGEGG